MIHDETYREVPYDFRHKQARFRVMWDKSAYSMLKYDICLLTMYCILEYEI